MKYEKEYEIKGIPGEGPYLILHQKSISLIIFT
jgi:hypothetical protein